MAEFTDDENKMLDIFVEISTAQQAGQRPRMGNYADRAITIMRKVRAEGFVEGDLTKPDQSASITDDH